MSERSVLHLHHNNMCHAEVPVTEAYGYIQLLEGPDTGQPARISVLFHILLMYLVQGFLPVLQGMLQP